MSNRRTKKSHSELDLGKYLLTSYLLSALQMTGIYSQHERQLLDGGDMTPFRRQFEDFGDHIYFNTSGRGALPKVSHQAAVKSVSDKKWPWLVTEQDESELRKEVAGIIADSQDEAAQGWFYKLFTIIHL